MRISFNHALGAVSFWGTVLALLTEPVLGVPVLGVGGVRFAVTENRSAKTGEAIAAKSTEGLKRFGSGTSVPYTLPCDLEESDWAPLLAVAHPRTHDQGECGP